MKKNLIIAVIAFTIMACNNSSDGTTTNDSTNTINDTINPAAGGTIDSSNTVPADNTRTDRDTATNTSDTTRR